MARQPVNEVAAMSTREALWKTIRSFGRAFSSHELRQESRCSHTQVRDYLQGLSSAGIISSVPDPDNQGNLRKNLYTLVKDCGIEAPRVRRDGTLVTQGRGREQMWETMRSLGQFSARDIHVFGSTEEHPVALSEAKTYCNILCRAGYLKRQGLNFLLVKRTGPKPPMIQRTKQVYDPNLGEIVWQEGGDL